MTEKKMSLFIKILDDKYPQKTQQEYRSPELKTMYDEIISKNYEIINIFLQKLSQIYQRHDEYDNNFRVFDERIKLMSQEIQNFQYQFRSTQLNQEKRLGSITNNIQNLEERIKTPMINVESFLRLQILKLMNRKTTFNRFKVLNGKKIKKKRSKQYSKQSPLFDSDEEDQHLTNISKQMSNCQIQIQKQNKIAQNSFISKEKTFKKDNVSLLTQNKYVSKLKIEESKIESRFSQKKLKSEKKLKSMKSITFQKKQIPAPIPSPMNLKLQKLAQEIRQLKQLKNSGSILSSNDLKSNPKLSNIIEQIVKKNMQTFNRDKVRFQYFQDSLKSINEQIRFQFDALGDIYLKKVEVEKHFNRINNKIEQLTKQQKLQRTHIRRKSPQLKVTQLSIQVNKQKRENQTPNIRLNQTTQMRLNQINRAFATSSDNAFNLLDLSNVRKSERQSFKRHFHKKSISQTKLSQSTIKKVINNQMDQDLIQTYADQIQEQTFAKKFTKTKNEKSWKQNVTNILNHPKGKNQYKI